MNEDTISLLKECNSGCKMATNSMEQVQSFIEKENLKMVIDSYNKKHIDIGDECHKLLNEAGENEKDPHAMQKVFASMSTEVKLRMNQDDEKIADIMVDGCSMGIKSLSKYLNQYKDASAESKDLVLKLVKIEQDFMNVLLSYL